MYCVYKYLDDAQGYLDLYTYLKMPDKIERDTTDVLEKKP